ncbi:MAG: hypothetical protein MN733_20215, partial [Nitrososphaera sp.]|nr:hypothetical protein [Nitrososphaera sp.]
QVHRITTFAADGHELNHVSYNLPLDGTATQQDSPRFTEKKVAAENWVGGAEVTTNYVFGFVNGQGQIVAPDNTIYKEIFGSSSNWQKGLVVRNEVLSQGIVKKSTDFTLTQDDETITFPKNPRLVETNTCDDAGNCRKTAFTPTSFGLVSDIREYATNGIDVLRHTHTDFNLDSAYLSRRIIGLPSAVLLRDGNGTLFGKTTFEYDLTSEFLADTGTVTQHDSMNYGIGLTVGRGNLSRTKGWNVNDPNNESASVKTEIGYNTTGSAIFQRDALGHQNNTSYTDSFSDGVNRGTLAYPTTVTDEDGFSSTVKYHYDIGVVQETVYPKGATRTSLYDSAGRLTRIETSPSGGYTRWEYPIAQTTVNTFSLLETGFPEFKVTQALDGLGRVRGTISDFPGSVGGFSARFTAYDVLGRVVQQDTPFEADANWNRAGDDSGSPRFISQSYDWQGRPRITTNADGTRRSITYSGCGCAGGTIITFEDEVGRQQRITQDVFGREVKVEALNSDQQRSVYSTKINAYNVRDQVTNIRQFQGANGTFQDTTFTYDGLGRLQSRKWPIESSPTIYTYNSDGTLQTVTDPRGAVSTYSYNARHLVSGITYGATDPNVPATSDVSFGYDSAGNRTSMTDGSGITSYTYNTLSRMMSETKTFNGLPNPFSITYDYNLAGAVKSITDPFGGIVTYSYEHTGRLRTVTGSGLDSVPTYIQQIQYRAWGAPKRVTYGNAKILTVSHNFRLQISNFNVPDVIGASFQYYADGLVRSSESSIQDEFDRSWVYDDVGRLSGSKSGKDAELGSDKIGPHVDTYTYDVWNNLTSRTSQLWGAPFEGFDTTYINNRDVRWIYNAAGQPVQMGTVTATYDAAGRQKSTDASQRRIGTLPPQQITLGNRHDGDGKLVRRTQNGIATYFLRSSVLGQVITELGDTGGKTLGFVYANGQLIAKKTISRPLLWVFQSPTNSSEREVNGNGVLFGGAEYD